jgi:beta-galactosidase
VELRYGTLSKRVGPDRETFPHLPHAPVVFDHRHFSPTELGLWGMQWLDGEIVGYIGGRPVAHVRLAADPLPTTLDVAPDRLDLEALGRDSTRVIVRVRDQAGNTLPFFEESIDVAVEGPARLIGPARIPLKGGTTGFWLETTGETGPIRLTVACPRFAAHTIDLAAR